jgi:flagellar L-ring protein precursor FlgH
MRFHILPLALAATLLAGCASVPDTQIKQPLTARPLPPPVAVDNNGAIFQAGSHNPRMGIALFEDHRARQVGDTLTVNLIENSNVKRTSSTTDERKVSGNVNVPAPTILGYHNVVGPTSISPSADNKLENTDNRSNVNTITGTITVTVNEVLPNGNLRVAGEKQLAINSQTEYIRLAGVVNPQLITSGNSINSTQLADVQFESKSTQGLDKAQVSTMLARFFLTVLPF